MRRSSCGWAASRATTSRVVAGPADCRGRGRHRTRRPRPACWRATTRRRARLRLDAREVARRRSAAGVRRAVAAACGPDDQPQRRRAISLEAAANLFCRPARARRRGRRGHCRHADPERGAGRGHQRPPAARRESRHERSTPARRALDARRSLERLAPSSGPSTRSPIPTSSCPTCASGATCTRAAPSIVLRPGHDRGGVARSWRSPTSTASPSCRRPATPASSAARSPMHGEILLSVGRLKRVRARRSPPATP